MAAYDIRFVPNFCCLFVGGSRTGKTTLFKRLMQSPDLFSAYPDRIYICHQCSDISQYAPLNQWPNVHFIYNGFPDIDAVEESGERTLIFVDDAVEKYLARFADDLLRVAVVDAHHSNVSLILACHQLFYRPLRQVRIQCQYIVLFAIPMAADSVKKFAYQFTPKNIQSFVRAYEESTAAPYGYLLCDNTQSVPRELRLRSRITENPVFVHATTEKN